MAGCSRKTAKDKGVCAQLPAMENITSWNSSRHADSTSEIPHDACNGFVVVPDSFSGCGTNLIPLYAFCGISEELLSCLEEFLCVVFSIAANWEHTTGRLYFKELGEKLGMSVTLHGHSWRVLRITKRIHGGGADKDRSNEVCTVCHRWNRNAIKELLFLFCEINVL